MSRQVSQPSCVGCQENLQLGRGAAAYLSNWQAIVTEVDDTCYFFKTISRPSPCCRIAEVCPGPGVCPTRWAGGSQVPAGGSQVVRLGQSTGSSKWLRHAHRSNVNHDTRPPAIHDVLTPAEARRGRSLRAASRLPDTLQSSMEIPASVCFCHVIDSGRSDSDPPTANLEVAAPPPGPGRPGGTA
jgi:hypothetical protein